MYYHRRLGIAPYFLLFLKETNTVEPRNSAKFGHPDFLRYCGVLRYLAGSLSHPKNHILKYSLNIQVFTDF